MCPGISVPIKSRAFYQSSLLAGRIIETLTEPIDVQESATNGEKTSNQIAEFAKENAKTKDPSRDP